MAAVAAGSALAGTAKSTKIVTFTGTYAGAANVTVSDTVATLAAAGPGKATTTGVAPVPKFGVGKLTGIGTSSADKSASCQTFNGTGTLTGVAGAKLNFKITGAQACGDSETGPWSISGRATVTGGAGRLQEGEGQPQGHRCLQRLRQEDLLGQVRREADGLVVMYPRSSTTRRNR